MLFMFNKLPKLFFFQFKTYFIHLNLFSFNSKMVAMVTFEEVLCFFRQLFKAAMYSNRFKTHFPENTQIWIL